MALWFVKDRCSYFVQWFILKIWSV
jgi:hypothetical protein